MNLVKNWDPVIEKVKKKLSSWKAKMLSFGGRMILCKSVLGSLPLYYLSLFKAPLSVIDKLEAVRREFLWGNNETGNSKICWVNWRKVIAPKHLGGLGIGSLKSANIALLVKWKWRYRVECNALWVKVIKSIHCFKRKSGFSLANSCWPGVWMNISKVLWNWNWKIACLDSELLSQVTQLEHCIKDTRLVNKKDEWSWKGDENNALHFGILGYRQRSIVLFGNCFKIGFPLVPIY